MEETDVVRAVQRTADRLRALPDVEVGYVPSTEDRDEGYPYVRVEAGELCYRVKERGRLLRDDRTRSLDELLHWVFHDVTHQMATAWELHLRTDPLRDGRRDWFPKWVELMTYLDPAWGARTQHHVDEVLARAPFRDRQ